MHYVVTGATGQIAKPLAQLLLNAGHEVTAISRNKNHLAELMQTGARAAIGLLEDVAFLEKAFEGADAVFTMYPSFFVTNDLKSCYENIGKNYAEAIYSNGIEYVVNLSSVGAHLPQGAGPISGLHRAEKALNALENVNIKHLRPVYFFTNFIANILMIKQMGIIGANFSFSGRDFPLAAPADISAAAGDELMNLSFKDHSVRYIASDESNTDMVAAILGKAIGKPDLRWVKFSDEQALQGMLQSGFPKALAVEFVEMFNAFNTGKVTEDYWKNRPEELGATKFEDFANDFAAAYRASESEIRVGG